ncbi:MAG TPA: hypothetical protein VLS51_06790 [Propionibacteriaceae bacterium]|nr:hypothetical protein [Propionibacteriaceae bacterium]
MDGNGGEALVLLVGALVVDVWIFLDARARETQGDAVVATVGPVTLSTSGQWLLGCLLLWVFVVPLYLVARNA